jgi:hypothetical protein
MNWSQLKGEGAPYAAVGLAIDPKHPNVLYTSGWDRYGNDPGVYRSANGARSWTTISGGMTTTLAATLTVAPNGRRLYVGSGTGDYGGGGVFAATVR